MKQTRTLYLTLIETKVLALHWQVHISSGDRVQVGTEPFAGYCIVRCNKKGDINFKTTVVYTIAELEGKNIQFVNVKKQS